MIPLYVIDQSHAFIRQVHLTTNSTQTILQNNSALTNGSSNRIYWHIHQMQSSTKIFILLRNANLDTLVSHIALTDISFPSKLEELTFSDTWCTHSIPINNNCDGSSYSELKYGVDQCKQNERTISARSSQGRFFFF